MVLFNILDYVLDKNSSDCLCLGFELEDFIQRDGILKKERRTYQFLRYNAFPGRLIGRKFIMPKDNDPISAQLSYAESLSIKRATTNISTIWNLYFNTH